MRRFQLPAAASPAGSGGTPTLVHLVRAANGPEPFSSFLTALRRFPPGGSPELVLALKGFASLEQAAPYLELAADLEPEPVLLPDAGFDLGAYLAVAARLRRDRYCFVNSYAQPLVGGWLAKLDAALATPGAGLVGTTGSWTSTHSMVLHVLRLKTPYRDALPERRVTREQFAALNAAMAAGSVAATGEAGDETESGSAARPSGPRLATQLTALGRVPVELLAYAGFPNPHIRTNGFMISHAALARMRLPTIRTKPQTYWLESGRHSITRQVVGLGLAPLVVDRDGVTYEPAEWDRSSTLWQGAQEGLMIADNQTRVYAAGDMERRRLLSALAWGPSARPSAPT